VCAAGVVYSTEIIRPPDAGTVSLSYVCLTDQKALRAVASVAHKSLKQAQGEEYKEVGEFEENDLLADGDAHDEYQGNDVCQDEEEVLTAEKVRDDGSLSDGDENAEEEKLSKQTRIELYAKVWNGKIAMDAVIAEASHRGGN